MDHHAFSLRPTVPKLALVTSWFLALATVNSPGSGFLADAARARGYSITEEGADFRVWSKLQTNQFGTTATNSFRVLTAGLNRWESNRWIECQPELIPTANAIVARGARHTALFATNANRASAFQIKMPDGQWFKGHCLCLMYHDTSTGSNVVFATIRDSTAQVQANRLVFTNCFQGAARANLSYSYSRAGISQEIRFLRRPPAPEAFGLSSSNAQLVAVSEITQSPQPQVAARTWRAGPENISDQDIKFSAMRLVPGRAFLNSNNKRGRGSAVAKNWQTNADGRVFLLERLQYRQVKHELEQLAPSSLSNTNSSGDGASLNQIERWYAQGSFPSAPKGKKTWLVSPEPRGAELLAKGFLRDGSEGGGSPGAATQVADVDAELAAISAPKEFILDWDLLESGEGAGSYYFACGTTTIIDGPCYLDYAAFGGQSVLKFSDNSSLEIGYGGLTYDSSVCGGPAILTGARDGSAGEDIASLFGYYGEPQYGDYGPALILDDCSYLSAVQDPNQFDIRYVEPGAVCSGPSLPTVTTTAIDPIGMKGATPEDTASFTVSRVDGDWSQALTVVLDISGTGINGSDYDVAAPTVVSAGQLIATIEPNDESTSVTIQPRVPSGAALEKSVMLTLVSDPSYTVGDFAAAVAYIEDPSAPTPAAIGAPNNVVSWWRGEDNGLDLVGANNGTPVNGAGYRDGFVGRAFDLGGWNQRIYIPDSTSLQLTHSLTIEGWFLFYDGWVLVHRGDERPGLDPYALGVNPYTLKLGCEVTDDAGTVADLESKVQVPPGLWFHAAMTLDDATGKFRLYQNGELVDEGTTTTRPMGPLLSGYDPSLCIGNVSGQSMAFGLLGGADEISIYDRALLPGEIQAVYNAGHGGKCAAPIISTQPQGQTVAGGGSTTLSVGISSASCSPLSYQWFHSGSKIAGATSSSLQLNNVHAIDAGQYKVAVANSAGSVASSAATLTVQEVARPVFNPVGGSFSSAQNVVITCATAGATIYYTLDGSEPDPSTSSSIASGNSVAISQNSTLKAKATKSPYLASATESEGYRINTAGERPTLTISPGDGATFLASDDIEVLVEAADLDGTISTIELFQNGVKVAESASSVLRYTAAQVFSGTYVFTARAMDDSGMVGTATPVTFTVNASGLAVTLVATQPFFNTSPATLTGRVVGVNPGELKSLTLNNATLTPLTGSIPLTAALTAQGANTFTLKAKDATHAEVVASTTVYYDSQPPAITITSPANGVSLSTSRVNVSGTFTEPNLKQITVNGVPAFINGNTFTALNVPLGGNVVAISAGEGHCLALRSDGTVVGWGLNDHGQATVPSGLTDVIAVSAGYYHSLALRKDGTVRAWGANDSGQRDVPTGLSDVVAISAGTSHSLALTSDGNLTTWGSCSPYGDCSIPSGLGNVRGVIAGAMYSLALRSDGTVRGWGNDDYGQVDVPGTVNSVFAVSAGGLHVLALLSDGTVTGWGDDGFAELEQPYPLTGIVAVSAGKFGHSLALKNDGTVVGWGANWENQADPPLGLTGVAAISASDFCSLALKADGTIVGWGDNEYGQVIVPPALNQSTITVTAEDIAGNLRTASVVVNRTPNSAGNLTDPVQFTASPTTGFAPLTVTLTPQSSVPGMLQHVYYDFDGDGVADLDNGTSLSPVQHVYSVGQFFPVVTVQTTVGTFSSPGGWNSQDPNGFRVNVQAQPQLVQTISVADPVDLKCTSDNKLYILSRSTATIGEYDVGVETPALIRSLSGIGTAPTGLDIDPSGNVYVAINGDHQVVRFAPNGASFIKDPSFGASGAIGKTDKSAGAGNGEFDAPYDVAVSPDAASVFVSDGGNNRVQHFDSAGAYLGSITPESVIFGEFNSPKGLSFSSDGALYLVDSGNSRIVRIFEDEVAGAFGALGSELGKYNSPANLVVDPQRIYIADAGNSRIQKLDGHSLTAILGIATELQLVSPSSVASGSGVAAERIYIADPGRNLVLIASVPQEDPLTVWVLAKQALEAGDVGTALQYFSSTTRDQFRDLFTALGTTRVGSALTPIGQLHLISQDPEEARFWFARSIGSQEFAFVVTFAFENGSWKIRNF